MVQGRLEAVKNEDGSIIFVALMLLAIMTVIGVMSADMTVTENFIVRNTGIRKQNVNLVEAAVMEGLQDLFLIDASNPNNFDPQASPTDWINEDDTWNDLGWFSTATARMLVGGAGANSVVPDLATNGGAHNLLQTRGEAANGGLRMAIVGWTPAPGSSLKATGSSRKAGRVLAEYVSLDGGGADNGYGMLRIDIGVERIF
jgi:hypothetical protein